MAAFQTEPLHAEFGAKLTGIDLAQPLDESTTAAIWDSSGVIGFLSQCLLHASEYIFRNSFLSSPNIMQRTSS